MEKIFSFALGSIWKWTKLKDKNILLDYIRKADLDIDGVEITFALKEDLYSFKLSRENKLWLRKLKYVTIHAPFRLVRRAKNKEEVIKQLDYMQLTYKGVGAKNLIIHPFDLPKIEILKKYDFNVSTENLPRKKRNITMHNKLKKNLGSYPKMKLCLDICHAYTWSKEETRELIEKYKNKISQIHFSATYRRRQHQSLRKTTDNFLESIEPIKKLGVPIVIEEDVKTRSLKYIREEIAFIKQILD